MISVSDKEEEEMLAQYDAIEYTSLRKPKTKRSNLLASATSETLKIVNEKTKKNRSLSNITYGRLYGEE